jgi:pyridoxal phosphate enzyme (YggS family)
MWRKEITLPRFKTMPVNFSAYNRILLECNSHGATLVAVTKTKPVEDILTLYNYGHRDFGENYVQELLEKQKLLPPDIRWHFIGHLQSNKVKMIAHFVHLIHGIDSPVLLKEIDKQGRKINRAISCLLQVYIATEETKFGFATDEAETTFQSARSDFQYADVKGLMGMASFTDNMNQVRSEFRSLRNLFDRIGNKSGLNILSMGMTSDYKVALEEGSTLLRIGSAIFGEREKH